MQLLNSKKAAQNRKPYIYDLISKWNCARIKKKTSKKPTEDYNRKIKLDVLYFLYISIINGLFVTN